MKENHLIDFNTFAMSEFDEIYHLTRCIMDDPGSYTDALKGKVIATLFYEPSTRTMTSFQAAALRLGASTVGFNNPSGSSVSKGETLKDTVRMMDCYADLIVIRHPNEGAAVAAAMYSDKPVVNAGDGAHLHPTQTLTDLVTLMKEKGRLDHLRIGVCGDLKNGRTVHSLLRALSRYEGNTFYLISTPKLRVPSYIRAYLDEAGVAFQEVDSIESCIAELDMLYMTRIQRERFANEEEYFSQRGIYILDRKKMSLAKTDMIIMHPLPKVDEITEEVDRDPRAKYIDQAKYGMFARMALIVKMLRGDTTPYQVEESQHTTLSCSNPRCITHAEPYLPPLRKEGAGEGVRTCFYCDHQLVEVHN